MWETRTQNYNHKAAKILAVVLFDFFISILKTLLFYLNQQFMQIKWYQSNDNVKWNDNEVMSVGGSNNSNNEKFWLKLSCSNHIVIHHAYNHIILFLLL